MRQKIKNLFSQERGRVWLAIFIILVAVIGSIITQWSVQAGIKNIEIDFEQSPLFAEVNFLPGHSVNRWVNFKNNTSETVGAAVKAINVNDPDNLGSWMDLSIKEGTTLVYVDTLENFFKAGEVLLTSVAGNGTEIQYNFWVVMRPVTGNALQGKSLSFDLQVGNSLEMATCGNEIKEGKEECDDGNNVDNDGCSANCALEVQVATGGGGGGGGSTGPYCGDGVVNGLEQCESNVNAPNGYTCWNCQLVLVNNPDNQETEENGSGENFNEESGEGGIVAGEQIVAGENAGILQKKIALEEPEANQQEMPGEVRGEKEEGVCLTCQRGDWLLILVLLALVVLFYRQIEIKYNNYLIEQRKNDLLRMTVLIVLSLATLGGVILILQSCGFRPFGGLLIILALMVLLLILNFWQKNKSIISMAFGIILALLIAVAYYFCAKWGLLSWLLVIGLYVAIMLAYFGGVLMKRVWLVAPGLVLLVYFLMLVLNRCSC